MRVAVIGARGYPSYYGGFETAVRRLAPYLCDHGWDVDVYSRRDALREDDPDRDPRVRVRITPGIERKSLSTLTYGLSSSVDTAWRRPDVALVMNVANGYWLPLLRARGIPTLVNVDGIEWHRAKWGRLAKAVFHQGAVWTARWADELVYDSEEIARQWQNEFRRKGVFIPYGGDEPPATLPPERGLGERGYALFVARFVEENTILPFLDAAEDLARSMDVVIVGSSGYGGPLDERVESLAKTNPRVHWLGHLSDDARLNSLWRHAGAYFHGHSVGGTNPALVQAMASGAPVVARDTPYNREVLGDSGIFAPPERGAIVKAILSLLEDRDLQERNAMAAVARAREHYSWNRVCGLYSTRLEELARFSGHRADEDSR